MNTISETAAIERCKTEFKTAWDKCDHLARFEAWADLYYRRFGRLCPGKSEAPETGCNSNDAENRALCDAWHSTGLAAHDAIMKVVGLEVCVESLRDRLEELVTTTAYPIEAADLRFLLEWARHGIELRGSVTDYEPLDRIAVKYNEVEG